MLSPVTKRTATAPVPIVIDDGATRLLASGEPGQDAQTKVHEVGGGATEFAGLPRHLNEVDTTAGLAPAYVRLVDHGGKFDRRPATIATLAGQKSITSPNAAFTSGDVGKLVFIPGAGAVTAPWFGTLAATIEAVHSPTTAMLTVNAPATSTAAAGYLGTNNDSAYAAAFAELAGGGTLELPAGHGMHGTQKTPPNHVRIVGAGRDVTTLHPLGGVNGFHFNTGSPTSPLMNVHFAEFTIDGDMQTNGVGAGSKGFGMYYMRGCTWTDVVVKNTAGSGFGNDYHQDCYYVRCFAENNGRIGTTASPGHSGFGFGTGGWLCENVYLIDCIARGNMRHGLFTEWQPIANPGLGVVQSAGVQVIGGRYEGNGVTGISDQSGRGIIVNGAHIVDNPLDGYSVTTTAAVNNIAVDGLLTNCVITGNGRDGVHLDWTHLDLPVLGRYRVQDNVIENNGNHGINIRANAVHVVPLVEVLVNLISSSYRSGVRLAGGSFRFTRVFGNTIVNNGQGDDGAGGGLAGVERAGIIVQTALADSEIANNVITDTRDSGKSQSHGVTFATSAPIGTMTGNSRLVDNELRGNGTAAFAGLGQVSGASIVRDNLTGVSAAINTKSGVSPLSHTCGVRPEQHFISGGEVTQVSLNGSNLLASGSSSAITQIALQPADVVIITSTSAPTWKFRMV